MAIHRFTIRMMVSSLILGLALTESSAQGFGRGPGPHGQGKGHQAKHQEPGGGKGPGRAFGRMGGGPPGDAEFPADRSVFQYLLANHEKIRRQVTNLDNGVETVTESDDPEIAAKIREHALAMHKRVKSDRGIHLRDPLFAEIFRNADRIDMAVGKTAKGVKVLETSEDPYVAKLIQAHAKVVTKFVARGHEEVRVNHEIPAHDTKAGAVKSTKENADTDGRRIPGCDCRNASIDAAARDTPCGHQAPNDHAPKRAGKSDSAEEIRSDGKGKGEPDADHHGHSTAKRTESR